MEFAKKSMHARKGLAIVAALFLFGASSAQAQLLNYTFTGTVSSGFDNWGVFGGVPTDLAGKSFTATFEVNLDNGFHLFGPEFQQIAGGDSFWENGSVALTPIISSTLSINGYSLNVGAGDQFGTAATKAPGGIGVQAANQSAAFTVHIVSSNLPFSYSTPLALYTVTDSDIVDSSLWGYGMVAYFNISTVSITEAPLPAAAWLFGSSLIGLTGLARQRKRVTIASR